jgi:hypothetical protein
MANGSQFLNGVLLKESSESLVSQDETTLQTTNVLTEHVLLKR